ncbi:MAG: hypothetical protein BM485_07880 [Desulfobulbaceae bacterium DB1]|nr:MAG: hypothetical protein BM485_07880 [Desulfobulbaceae bacterium DB1]
MIKIAFVIDTIESPTAGTEKQLLLLIRNLDRRKFLPYLCVLRSSPWLKETFKDCPLIDLEFGALRCFRSVMQLLKFVRYLKQERIDIVQTYFVDANKIGVVAGCLAGVKSVISSRRNQGYWIGLLELLQLRFLNCLTTHFIANSHSTKQWAMKREGIPGQKISVILNGIELEYYDLSRKAKVNLRKEYNTPDCARLVCIVANLRPVKGHEIFLRAARIVADQISSVYFVIIGEGQERKRLERLASELSLSKYVFFLGKREDVADLLLDMDVGVLASHSESFSNALVEYLACGLPVVVTDVGGAREAVQGGVNGFVISLDSASEGLARGILGALRMNHESVSALNRKIVQELFAKESMVAAYQNLYHKLVGDHG